MKTLRFIIWSVLILGWLIAILWAFITSQDGLGAVFCLSAIVTWITAGCIFGWIFGIKRHVKKHLRSNLDESVELKYPPHPRDRQDVARALEAICEASSDNQRLGLVSSVGSLLQLLRSNTQLSSLEWESFDVADNDWEEFPTNAVYLLTIDGLPCVAALVSPMYYDDDDTSGDSTYRKGTKRHLQIVANEKATCRLARRVILDKAREVSALRGKVIIVRPSGQRGEPEVAFSHIDEVDRSRIILPEHIFEAVNRTVLQQLAASETLKKAGQRTRTAILLFGPPGTGKTLLTRHLVSQSPGYTTILLQGFQRELVRESFRLARYLEPALVILEDVDLIAVRRQRNRAGTTALHALLDELDGLAPESRCAVIMTTNRPDVLEPALASRPGRVTQAIEFPKPNQAERADILRLFFKQVDHSQVSIEEWASKTDGASPAFLEELVRRSILIAHGLDTADLPKISDDHVRDAMHEIVTLGGTLTQNLLGHSSET